MPSPMRAQTGGSTLRHSLLHVWAIHHLQEHYKDIDRSQQVQKAFGQFASESMQSKQEASCRRVAIAACSHAPAKEQTTTDYGIVSSALHEVPLQQQLPVVHAGTSGETIFLGLCRSRAGLGVRVLWNSIAAACTALRTGDMRFTKESVHLIDSQKFRLSGLLAGLDHAEIARKALSDGRENNSTT